MRIGLLGVSFDTQNLGVSALTAGTIQCILRRWPRAEVFILDYGKTGRTYTFEVGHRQVSIPLVNMRFSPQVYLKNHVAFLILLCLFLKLIPFKGLRHKIVVANPCLKELETADVVVSMAGGDSFSDTYGLSRMAYGALPQLLALFAGKKLVLLPQTLGPFKSQIARFTARYILRRAQLVYARDHRTLRETAEALGFGHLSGKFRFHYDVGFVVDAVAPAQMDLVGLAAEQQKGSCRVGLNVSGLLAMGGYTRRNMFGLRADYNRLVRELIEFLIDIKNAEVLLVPHVFGRVEESDAAACEEVYEELKTRFQGWLGFVRGSYNQSEIKYIIGSCGFFIGSRMHACIAALSQNVPTVAIAYTDKFIGVMESIGMGGSVADPRGMTEEEMVMFVDRIFARRAAVRQELERTMPQVKTTALRLFEDIEAGCSLHL
jgi:polysaccharide pyruvyl transferase WcaK-like protein